VSVDGEVPHAVKNNDTIIDAVYKIFTDDMERCVKDTCFLRLDMCSIPGESHDSLSDNCPAVLCKTGGGHELHLVYIICNNACKFKFIKLLTRSCAEK
jgi:hypothetical protein